MTSHAVLTPDRVEPIGPAPGVSAPPTAGHGAIEGVAFDSFYTPLLAGFAADLRTRLAPLPGCAVEHDSVVAGAGDDLARDLVRLCSRTLVALFHDELTRTGQLPPDLGADPPEDGAGAGLPCAAYQAFHQRLATAEGHQEVFAAAPVLQRLVRILVQGRADLIDVAVHRLIDDQELGLLGEVGDPGRLTAARVVGADSHNGGRQVVLLEGEQRRLVYKPRSLATDRVLADIVAELNESLDPQVRLRPVPVLDRGDHGWQAFIEAQPCPDIAAARRYFRRLGIYLALFHRIGAGDLHRENVIAVGEHPQFVDLETSWTRRPERTPPASAAELFQGELDDSVLSTMLLPARVVGSPFDMNNAGIGALGAQQSRRWTAFHLVGLGSDYLRFVKRQVHTSHVDNLVYVQGVPMDPVQFADEVDAGFQQGSSVLTQGEAVVLQALRTAADRGLAGRQVLRATALYGTLLEATSHPAYLSAEADRSRILRKLRPQPAFRECADAVQRAEVDALDVGDVPYFTSALGDTGLLANDHVWIPGVYPSTLLDDVVDTIGRRAARDTERDRYLIHMSLLTGQSTTWEHVEAPPGRFAAEIFRDPQPLAVARAIGDFLTRIVVRTEGLRPVTWVTPLVDSAAFCTLGPLNTSLYEGGGALLFLSQLAGLSDDAALRDLVLRAVLDHPAWGFAELELAGPAGFTGAAGAAYLLGEMGRHLREPRLAELSRVAWLAAVRRLPELGRQHWDLIGGVAGTALALVAATTQQDRRREPALTDGLAQLATQLPSPSPGDGTLAAGAAHGGSAAVLAAARLGTALGDERLARSARTGVERLVQARCDQPLSAVDLRTWCRGLSGDLPALALALAELGVNAKERTDILEPLLGGLRDALTDPPGTDVSLCHGEAGLIVAGQELDRLGVLPGGRVLASRRLRAVASGAWARGYTGGLRHSAGLVTFMAGLTGFGHAALRDTGPVVPSALTFEGGGS